MLGDVLAQNLEGSPSLDFARVLHLGAYGFFLDGPIGHLWYKCASAQHLRCKSSSEAGSNSVAVLLPVRARASWLLDALSAGFLFGVCRFAFVVMNADLFLSGGRCGPAAFHVCCCVGGSRPICLECVALGLAAAGAASLRHSADVASLRSIICDTPQGSQH
jgi:hypothetical protein